MAVDGSEYANLRPIDIVGTTLYKQEKVGHKEINCDQLDGKYIGLYFSAHWCPPCKRFTPELAKTYRLMRGTNQPFEVVFVSLDKTETQFKEYFASMPWLAMPFNQQKNQGLMRKYGVSAIPTLLILDQKGLQVLNRSGVQSVIRDPEAKDFPWQGESEGYNRYKIYLVLAVLVFILWIISNKSSY